MSDGERGSILIEALVSTAVVAAAMTMMLVTVEEAGHRRAQIETRREAVLVATSQMAAVGAAIPLQAGAVQGVDGDFIWRVRVEPGQANALNDGLASPPATVTVTVRPASGGQDLVTLRTLKVAP